MSSFLTQEQKNKVRRRLFVEDNPVTAATSDDLSGITPLKNCNGGPADSTVESTTRQEKVNSSVNQNKSNPTDAEEIDILDLSNMTQQQKFEQMNKWNFDFDNEIPLNGIWEWERVEPPRRTIVDHKEKVSVLGKEEPGDRNV